MTSHDPTTTTTDRTTVGQLPTVRVSATRSAGPNGDGGDSYHLGVTSSGTMCPDHVLAPVVSALAGLTVQVVDGRAVRGWDAHDTAGHTWRVELVAESVDDAGNVAEGRAALVDITGWQHHYGPVGDQLEGLTLLAEAEYEHPDPAPAGPAAMVRELATAAAEIRRLRLRCADLEARASVSRVVTDALEADRAAGRGRVR